MSVYHLLFSVTTFIVLVPPAGAQELDSGKDERSKGSTTVKGSYRLFRDGQKVKLAVQLFTRQSGANGTGKGAVAIVLTDLNGEQLFKKAQGVTVGADALRGSASYRETFSLPVGVANELAGRGGAALFRVDVDKDNINIPKSLQGWKGALGAPLQDLIGGLGPGKSRSVNGWVIKRITGK